MDARELHFLFRTSAVAPDQQPKDQDMPFRDVVYLHYGTDITEHRCFCGNALYLPVEVRLIWNIFGFARKLSIERILTRAYFISEKTPRALYAFSGCTP